MTRSTARSRCRDAGSIARCHLDRHARARIVTPINQWSFRLARVLNQGQTGLCPYFRDAALLHGCSSKRGGHPWRDCLALIVLDGGHGVAEKKERVTRGWRRERRVDRLILSKFIEPPSDGDDISDCTSLCNVREGNNQRGFEVSRARRRFLHLDRSLRRLMNGAAVWLVTFRRDRWFCRGSVQVWKLPSTGVMELEKENIRKERWKSNSKFVMCIASSIYEARNRPDGWG